MTTIGTLQSPSTMKKIMMAIVGGRAGPGYCEARHVEDDDNDHRGGGGDPGYCEARHGEDDDNDHCGGVQALDAVEPVMMKMVMKMTIVGEGVQALDTVEPVMMKTVMMMTIVGVVGTLETVKPWHGDDDDDHRGGGRVVPKVLNTAKSLMPLVSCEADNLEFR